MRWRPTRSRTGTKLSAGCRKSICFGKSRQVLRPCRLPEPEDQRVSRLPATPSLRWNHRIGFEAVAGRWAALRVFGGRKRRHRGELVSRSKPQIDLTRPESAPASACQAACTNAKPVRVDGSGCAACSCQASYQTAKPVRVGVSECAMWAGDKPYRQDSRLGRGVVNRCGAFVPPSSTCKAACKKWLGDGGVTRLSGSASRCQGFFKRVALKMAASVEV